MSNTLKKFIFWSIGIFIPVFMIIIVILIAVGINLGKIIAILILSILFLLAIIGVVWWLIERKKYKEITAQKEIAVLTPEQAEDLIRKELRNKSFAEYLDNVDDKWTLNFGLTKHPIYCIKGKASFSKNMIVGLVNLITGRYAIRFYNTSYIKRENIEKDVIEIANLLSGSPIEKRFETIERSIPILGGYEKEIREIEEKKEEKKQEGGIVE